MIKMKLTEFLQSIKTEEVLLEDGKFAGAKLTKKSARKLQKWIEENDIGNPVPSSEFHVTILYSDKVDFPWDAKKYPGGLKVDPHTYELALFGEEKNILVLKFDSPEMAARHHKARDEHGVDWKFDEYQPHVTLSYKVKDLDLSDLEPPGFPLYFSHEYYKDNDEEYVKKLKDNVTESKVIKVPTMQGDETAVHVNPTYSRMFSLLYRSERNRVRGVVTRHGGEERFLVWDAADMTHHYASHQLGVSHSVKAEYEFMLMYGNIELHRGSQGEFPDVVKRAITPPITEAKAEVVNSDGQRIVVLKNPSHEQLLKQIDTAKHKQVRGMVDKRGVLYTWNAYMVTHHYMEELLGFEKNDIQEHYTFQISSMNNELKVYPASAALTMTVSRAMGGSDVTEAKMVNNDQGLKLYQNPTPSEFLKLLKQHGALRAIGLFKDFYVWDAHKATHPDVSMYILHVLPNEYKEMSTYEFQSKDYVENNYGYEGVLSVKDEYMEYQHFFVDALDRNNDKVEDYATLTALASHYPVLMQILRVTHPVIHAAESKIEEVTGELRITPTMKQNAVSNKCQTLVTMHPLDFLKLTTTTETIDMIKKEAKPLFRYNQFAKLGDSPEYVEFLSKLKGEDQWEYGAVVHPFLRIDIGSHDAFVVAHEGRHRAASLLAKGGTEMPVALCLRTTKKHPRDNDTFIIYDLSFENLPYLVGGQYSHSTYVTTRDWKVVQDGMLKKYLKESLEDDVRNVLTDAAKGSLLLPADIDVQKKPNGIEIHINSVKFNEDTLKRKFLFRAKGEEIRRKVSQSGGIFKKVGNMYHLTFTNLTNNFFVQRKALLGHLAAGLGRTFSGVNIDIQGDRVSTDSDEVKYHHAYIRVFIPKRM